MRRHTRPSTTACAGSEPAATPARRSVASPRLHAGRTQSGLGPLSGGVRRNTADHHCPCFTHRLYSGLVGSGHSMLDDDMPGFDTPAADVTMSGDATHCWSTNPRRWLLKRVSWLLGVLASRACVATALRAPRSATADTSVALGARPVSPLRPRTPTRLVIILSKSQSQPLRYRFAGSSTTLRIPSFPTK